MEPGIKNWNQGVCVQTALNSSFALLSQLTINFSFVLTPKSAVKSSRQTRRIFSTNTNSLICAMYALCTGRPIFLSRTVQLSYDTWLDKEYQTPCSWYVFPKKYVYVCTYLCPLYLICFNFNFSLERLNNMYKLFMMFHQEPCDILYVFKLTLLFWQCLSWGFSCKCQTKSKY